VAVDVIGTAEVCEAGVEVTVMVVSSVRPASTGVASKSMVGGDVVGIGVAVLGVECVNVNYVELDESCYFLGNE
jgi:hypothetical protein